MRKLRPCLSYSRRRDHIDLGLLHSYCKAAGQGGLDSAPPPPPEAGKVKVPPRPFARHAASTAKRPEGLSRFTLTHGKGASAKKSW